MTKKQEARRVLNILYKHILINSLNIHRYGSAIRSGMNKDQATLWASNYKAIIAGGTASNQLLDDICSGITDEMMGDAIADFRGYIQSRAPVKMSLWDNICYGWYRVRCFFGYKL